MQGHESNAVPVGQSGGHAFTFRDIIFILYRRKLIIIAVMVPIIMLGGLNLFRQTGSFTASSKLLVELTKVENPEWNTRHNIDYDRELSTFTNIANSILVVETAALALADSAAIILEYNPEMIVEGDDNWLIGYLAGGLSVSVVGESTILEFQFTSIAPRISLMCVGALRDAFIEYQVFGRKNVSAIGYYEEQINTVRSELDSLLQVRRGVLEASGYFTLKDELRYDSGQEADVENNLFKAQGERIVLETEHDLLVTFLSGEPRDFPMGQDESRSHSLVYWRNIVSKHEDELNKMLSIYTDDSTPVKRQRELLDKALVALTKEQHNYVESLAIKLKTAKNKEAALIKTISNLKSENRRGLEVSATVSLLDVEINSMRSLLEDLQGKWGEVRINQLADERVSNIVELTEPEMMMSFSGGKTIVFFVMIVFFGVTMGIVAAFLVDTFDHRIYSVKDVEINLNMPVFASISKGT